MPWPENVPSEWASPAYAITYGRVVNRLRRRGLSHEQAGELAEEGTQHAFLRVAQGKGPATGFRDQPHFVSWLVLVAYRRAMELLRKRRPESILDQAEATNRSGRLVVEVQDCIDKLALQERRVILLSYYHALTDVEIGLLEFNPREEDPEPSPSALGQRVFRTRRAARACLLKCLLLKGVDPVTWEVYPDV